MGPALELIITGRVIGAAEAARIGLVNEITPSGHCLERALELAGEISELPQTAMRTDLEAALRGFGEPLDRGLGTEAECFDRLLEDPELVRGAARFVSRDHPDRKPGAPPLHLPGRAYALAERAHGGALDRYGRDPFILHPASVAEIVSVFDDPEIEAAAYLHDTVEKAGVGIEEIEASFGPGVAGLVSTLSQDPAVADRDFRRAEHRERVASAGWKAQAIYTADRIDGIRRMADLIEDGCDPEDLEAGRRIAAWRGDLEAIAGMSVPPWMTATVATDLARLETLASSGG
jgi:hypothetical protein